MLLLNGGSIRAQNTVSLTPDIITHITLLPESASAEGIKIAATWWLPDWQDSQKSRGNQCEGGVCEGGDLKGDCGNYGLYQTCPSPKISTGITHPTSDLTCQKSCYCPVLSLIHI